MICCGVFGLPVCQALPTFTAIHCTPLCSCVCMAIGCWDKTSFSWLEGQALRFHSRPVDLIFRWRKLLVVSARVLGCMASGLNRGERLRPGQLPKIFDGRRAFRRQVAASPL